jgi:hypothetical protein
MFSDFPVLYVDLIVRRTLVSCVVLAVVALAGAVVLGQALAGVGIVLGLAGATANHRLFQLSTVHYSTAEGHLDRKPYAGTVAARLGGLTIVAFALLFFVRPMGFGMVGGLVAFQVLLMANALGSLWRYQRTQLSGPASLRPTVDVESRSGAVPPVADQSPSGLSVPTGEGDDINHG